MSKVISRKINLQWAGKRISEQIIWMLSQLIPVAIGVFLGIIASEWNSARKQRAAQKEFLQNLSLEIESNKKKIQQSMAYHKIIKQDADSVKKVLSKEVLSNGFWASGGWRLIPHWRGTQVPALQSSVYQTGIIGNTLSGLDFTTINSIAQTYNQQDEYKLISSKLFREKIWNLNKETTDELLGQFGWLHDVIYNEQILIQEYERSLKHIQSKTVAL